MTDTQDTATALFRELTGRTPDGLWSAPGRVNLIGEHTDYNDGFVLPFAIPHRTVAAVGVRDDGVGRVRVASTFAAEPVEVALDDLATLFPTATGSEPAVPEWAAYPLGVAWALAEAAGRAGAGVDIAIASDVPGRTPMRFVGRDVLGSFGAARLAADAGAPVVVMTSEEDGRGPYIRLHEPLEPERFDSPQSLLAAMLAIHEEVVLRWPEATDLPLSRWGSLEPSRA